MPEPLRFSNRQELVDHLASNRHETAIWFNKGRWTCSTALVHESAQGNTWMAFMNQPKLPQRPSDVFRSWACNRLETEEFWVGLGRLKTQTEFDSWHAKLANDLHDHWHSQMNQGLRIGIGRKLVNILLKQVVCWHSLQDSERKRLIDQLHVPFDKFSLAVLQNCTPVADIPNGASMSYIAGQSLYDALQDDCRAIAKEAGVAPILIDIVAWNSTHSDYSPKWK